MSTPLGDLYGDLNEDPNQTPDNSPPSGSNVDATPPGVGTEEHRRAPAAKHSDKLAVLKMMGVPIEVDRFFEMAMDPRPFGSPSTYTMQVPLVMKDFLSKLVKSLSVMHGELSLSQIQRLLVALAGRHLDELIEMVEMAQDEADRQRQQQR